MMPTPVRVVEGTEERATRLGSVGAQAELAVRLASALADPGGRAVVVRRSGGASPGVARTTSCAVTGLRMGGAPVVAVRARPGVRAAAMAGRRGP